MPTFGSAFFLTTFFRLAILSIEGIADSSVTTASKVCGVLSPSAVPPTAIGAYSGILLILFPSFANSTTVRNQKI